MMPTRAAPPPTARLKSAGVHWTSSPVSRITVTPSVIPAGQRTSRHEFPSGDCRISASLDDLRALRRLRLRHVLIEPDLIAVGIHHREGPVSPPLRLERQRGADAALPDLVVKAVHVLHLEVDLDRPLLCRTLCAVHGLLGPHQHDLCAVAPDGAEVELPVLPHDPHHVSEPELLHVVLPQLVNGLHRDHRHDRLRRVLAHRILRSWTVSKLGSAPLTFNYFGW